MLKDLATRFGTMSIEVDPSTPTAVIDEMDMTSSDWSQTSSSSQSHHQLTAANSDTSSANKMGGTQHKMIKRHRRKKGEKRLTAEVVARASVAAIKEERWMQERRLLDLDNYNSRYEDTAYERLLKSKYLYLKHLSIARAAGYY